MISCLRLFTATPFYYFSPKHGLIRCLSVRAHRRSFLFEETTECLFLLIDLPRSFFKRLKASERVYCSRIVWFSHTASGFVYPWRYRKEKPISSFLFSPPPPSLRFVSARLAVDE